MKNFKLKKLLTLLTVTLLTAVAISPIKASAAWKQSANGTWSYTEANTSVSGWKSIDGKWYFFDSNAVMKTGWVNDGGKWYYTASSGAMQTGWISDNGFWYYLNTSGDMKTGLVELNNKTYYLSDSGSMKTGNVTINGTSYTFAANGEKITTTNATANTTTAQGGTVANGTTTTSGGSGGSSSSDTSTSSDSPLYKNLYGTWNVASYIPKSTSKSLNQEDQINVNTCINQQFIIAENTISATIPSLNRTVSFKPTVKDSTMTASAFKTKWGFDVSGTTVNCVNISYGGYSVVIFITDDNTYASLKGYLFKIEKQ
jgi:hypothetical protein